MSTRAIFGFRATLASLALALGAGAATAPATAADMYDRNRSSAYEDPRYADIYTYPDSGPRRAPPHDDYLPPMPRKYFDGERRHSNGPGNCASHHDIRRDLVEQGWNEFHDLELRGASALIEARRPNGQLYQLKIDRCSGEILQAQRLGDRRPYAYRNGERPF
jgi:hypothetical protein